MKIRNSIIISDLTYEILYCEHDIFQPDFFHISPTWSDDKEFAYTSQFYLDDYQLYLNNLIISSDRCYPEINGISPEPYILEQGRDAVQYSGIMEALGYTGSMIIATQLVKKYTDNSDTPCFSYKFVKELVFREGKLITTIDHSKGMLRIRKNLDSGLRSLDKKRDIKCIQRFIMTSFAGDYKKAEKRYQKLLKLLHRKTYFEKVKKI